MKKLLLLLGVVLLFLACPSPGRVVYVINQYDSTTDITYNYGMTVEDANGIELGKLLSGDENILTILSSTNYIYSIRCGDGSLSVYNRGRFYFSLPDRTGDVYTKYGCLGADGNLHTGYLQAVFFYPVTNTMYIPKDLTTYNLTIRSSYNADGSFPCLVDNLVLLEETTNDVVGIPHNIALPIQFKYGD